MRVKWYPNGIQMAIGQFSLFWWTRVARVAPCWVSTSNALCSTSVWTGRLFSPSKYRRGGQRANIAWHAVDFDLVNRTSPAAIGGVEGPKGAAGASPQVQPSQGCHSTAIGT
jgi:hypothetical protein